MLRPQEKSRLLEIGGTGRHLRCMAPLDPLPGVALQPILDEAFARVGDRLASLAVGRGGPEERSADGRAARALREIDRAAAGR